MFLPDDGAPAIYGSVPECDIAIVCACSAAVRIVLSHLYPLWFGGSLDSAGDAHMRPHGETPIPEPSNQVDPITKSIAWGMNGLSQMWSGLRFPGLDSTSL